MKSFVIRPAACFKGRLNLCGDKSIAHRAIILSSISKGPTLIRNFPLNEDCLVTLGALKKLGIKIIKARNSLLVRGGGLRGLRKPRGRLFLKESGTTFRLFLGLLAGQRFSVRLTAAKSLARRPMLRVNAPLRQMGASIDARCKIQNAKPEEYPPITIHGRQLRGITYRMPIASAQVKGAVLLAGLYAAGRTCVIEPGASRDHSERMLKLFKAKIKVKGNTILIEGRQELSSPGKIYIPGDISSASFFMLLAAISPQAHLVLEKIGLNHSRYGIIRVLKRMGANLRVKLHRAQESGSEPMGDISIRSSKLTGVTVKKKEIPSLIDELPVLMAAACFAKGRSVFEGAGELRVKETDRIRSMSENLRKMGASISVCAAPAGENIIIIGKGGLRGAKVKSFGDHRTAMSIVVAGLAASGQTHLDDISCIRKSFPDFIEKLKSVTVG